MFGNLSKTSCNEFCYYGFGQIAKYQTKSGKHICSPSQNSCPENRKKNSQGLKKAYDEGRKDNIHWDGKRGWSKGGTAYSDRRI